MRDYGCSVVAEAKLIYENGIKTSSFNPDVYYKWCINNGYVNSGGYIYPDNAVKYANYLGNSNLSYLGQTSNNCKNKILSNTSNGYYSIVRVKTSSGGTHFVLVDNAKTKSTGKIYFYESFGSVTSNIPSKDSYTLSEMGHSLVSVRSFKYTKATNQSLKITFNGNGGTASKSSLSISKGGTMGNNIPSATRNGYSFNGWYTAKSGGTKYSGNTKINSNTTLYAQWSANNKNVLKSGHIYRIYNYNSRLPIQANGSGNGALVRQQTKSNTNLQLWKVTDADSNGYYRISNVYGGRMLDVNGGSFNLKTNIIVYNNEGTSNQQFSLIKRSNTGGKDLYSIHPKSTGRVLDIRDSSKSSGAQLQQYYYNGNNNQLFYFEEVTDRSVSFYDNITQNYLPTPKDVYDYSGSTTPQTGYLSRNTDYVTTSVDPEQNKLIITAKKTGSSGNDMNFMTTVNGSYNYDMYDANTSTMYLYFIAKSSVDGAKMYFRWGYDPTTNCKSVTLSTTEEMYVIELPRTMNSGSNLHPWIDTACTVEMQGILLTTDRIAFALGKEKRALLEIVQDKTDIYNNQIINYNINNNNGTYGTLPQPKTANHGYVFEGWYTQRVGGTKITDSSKIGYNTKLYAHWKEAELSNITILEMPEKQTYYIGDVLDTSGLKLKLTYSDGSTKIITSGFKTSGFDSSTIGTKTVTISYGDKATSYTVTVKAAETTSDSPELVIEQISSSPDSIVFDVKLMQNNAEITPAGAIEVKMPIPENIDIINFKLYRQESDGTYTNIDTVNINEALVFTTKQLGIYILSKNDPNQASVLNGDVDADGEITDWDAIMLNRYLAGWDVTIDLTAADTDKDGEITDWDAILLNRYLAGWDVEL